MTTPNSFSLTTSGSAFDSILTEVIGDSPTTDTPNTPLAPSAPPLLTAEQRRELAVIAEDIALFGDSNFDQILTANGLSHAQFTQFVEPNPVFKAATALINAQLAEDPHLAERRKAKQMFSMNMSVLTRLAQDPVAENKDKINAMKLLAEIADMGPRKYKEDKGDGGPMVTINFGDTLGAKLRNTMVIDQ
jgi:hypothetical protein